MTEGTGAAARGRIIARLKEDHKRLRRAYAYFLLLDHDAIPEAGIEIVETAVAQLEVHAALEKEFMYTALRNARMDEEMIIEALVDHAAIHTLIGQLRTTAPSDKGYVATFIFLCEYTLRHIRKEEHEIFAQLQRLPLDWETLAREMDRRRQQLEANWAPGASGADPDRD